MRLGSGAERAERDRPASERAARPGADARAGGVVGAPAAGTEWVGAQDVPLDQPQVAGARRGEGAGPVDRGTPTSTGARPGAIAALAALAALPWTWFALRDVHPALDLVAITLPLLVAGGLVAMLVATVVSRRALLFVPAVSVVAFGAVAVVGPWVPSSTAPPRHPVVVLTANIAGPESDAGARAVSDRLAAAGADVVVVDELSPEADRMLRRSFSYHAETFVDGEENPTPPAVGVFTRLPIVDVGPAPVALPGLRLVLAGPAGRFVLYAMHVPKAGFGGGHWSVSFAGHDRLLERLAAQASAESLPAVVAGDLNTPDRSRGYRRLAASLRDAARTGWSGPTSVKASLLWRFLALRVDHVFIVDDWCAAGASRLALPGSDHRGVRVAIGPCTE
jgi:endonuclease/exonuclease/phosphatase (EEP) superfamily protein YafD